MFFSMPICCRHCPLRSLDVFEDLDGEEIRALERFKAGELKIGKGTQIMLEGASSPQLFTALSGQGLRHKTLQNGRRQVLNFVFPGDFLGLQAGIMGEMKHAVEATTDMVLCVFDRKDFFGFFRNHPSRAYDITWIAATEEHFLGEALASVGQLSATERMAWAIMRLHARAGALGMLIGGSRIPMPYRQQDMADALGLSLVHTNKTLARLRDRQLASWTDGHIQITDYDGLARLAGPEAGEPLQRRPLI